MGFKQKKTVNDKAEWVFGKDIFCCFSSIIRSVFVFLFQAHHAEEGLCYCHRTCAIV